MLDVFKGLEGTIISRTCEILVIPGGGIGPEVMAESVKVLKATGADLKLLDISRIEEDYDAAETFITDPYLYKCDAILIGAVGRDVEPLDALSKNVLSYFNREKEIFANVRPFRSMQEIRSTMGNGSVDDIDMVVIRDYSEGFSRSHKGYSRGTYGVDKRIISDFGARRIAKYAFEFAVKKGRSRVTCVDQSNWLHSDKIFRKSFTEVSRRYPSIRCDCLHVDVAAMMVSHSPEEFDVIVTPHMYGDILSGIVIGKIGGIGLAPSASIGGDFAFFEPVHGMALDIAGKGMANPIASILSAGLMLEWLGMDKEAWLIERAVSDVVAEGKVLARDLGGRSYTWDVGDEIANRILLMMNEKRKYEKKLQVMTVEKLALEQQSINTHRRTDVIIEEREPG